MSDGTFTIKATSVALAAVVIAAATTITMIVVLSLSDADALAAVALAFGLVAFMAQLVIAVAQFGSAERSHAEVGRINADTQAALSELRRANDEIVASQRGVVERLIGQALTSVEAQASTPAEVQAVERVRANLLGIVPTQPLPDPGRDERTVALQDTFKEWVEREGLQYVESPADLDGAPVIKIDDHFLVVAFSLGSAQEFGTDAYVLADRLRRLLIDEAVLGLHLWERGDKPGAFLTSVSGTVHAWPEVLSQVPRMIRENLSRGDIVEDNDDEAGGAEHAEHGARDTVDDDEKDLPEGA